MGVIKQEVRDLHLNRYPTEQEFINSFLGGFDINYGARISAANTALSAYILSPLEHIKTGYGLNNEIALFYSPYPKIEPRSLQAIEQIFTTQPFRGRVENINYFFISDDIEVKDWLDSYYLDNQESRIIIPFSKKELIDNKGNDWFVRNRLGKLFFGRDLFGYTLPLMEDTYFFGRGQMIANYLDSIKRFQNRGVFGLRKTGKTSFLFKLQRIINSQQLANVFFYDCKSPSFRKLRWNQFLAEICRNISIRLRLNIAIKEDEDEIIQIFRVVLKEAKIRNQRILLIFDEVEYISFLAILNKHWHEDFIEFWQTIWSAQSIHRNLTFIIAGVNPAIIESDKVNGVQNPLFGIVQSEYLKGLELEEIKTMIKTLGRKMGLKFDFDAIDYLYEWYGGHPLLTRLACSWINKDIQNRKTERPVQITKKNLLTEQTTRDSDLVFYCKHVVSELQDFYPDEYEMLELLSSGQKFDFVELATVPEYVKHLINYGLIKYDINNNPKISIPVVGRYVGIELAKKEKRNMVLKIIEQPKRLFWLEQRKMAILRDIRMLEKIIQQNKLPSLFGANSFIEADEFKGLTIVNSRQDFSTFINVSNRCFVESIEQFGKSMLDDKYFWTSIKNSYPGLFHSLERIKVYRNEADHILLNNVTNEKLLLFLSEDLEGQKPSQVNEIYFLLQQVILDGLLTGIQIEMNRLS